jgi:hypothetical protein
MFRRRKSRGEDVTSCKPAPWDFASADAWRQALTLYFMGYPEKDWAHLKQAEGVEPYASV